MALCSGVAAVTLTFGVLGSLPALIRRLAGVRLPIPLRPLAVLLMMTSMTAVLARPRPTTAAIAPPIVRLVDEIAPPTDGSEHPKEGTEISVGETEAEVPASSSPPSRSTGTSTIRAERRQSRAVTYVVERGDSLWRIAAFVLRSGGDADPTNADIARFWPAIYAANRDLIGDDPNLIFPGQQLLIPEG
jgi:nucleoid-associated protein YgaU